jgi:hypothetical protein
MGILERARRLDLIKKGILDWKQSRVPQKTDTFFYLKDDLKAFKQIVEAVILNFANTETLFFAPRHSQYTRRMTEKHVLKMFIANNLSRKDLLQEKIHQSCNPKIISLTVECEQDTPL